MTKTILSCALLALVLAAAPATATTLQRASLESLVAHNDTIVVGEVLEAHSYWNDDGTFILTDVRVLARDVLKGDAAERVLTVTVMGGTVGDLTTLVIGTPELAPGHEYVLFLHRVDLPGAPSTLSIPAHVQGAFDVAAGPEGPRAVSQAAGLPLMPDLSGLSEAAGGVHGMPLPNLAAAIRELAARPRTDSREVIQ